jgi:phenylacetate-CoA ligase
VVVKCALSRKHVWESAPAVVRKSLGSVLAVVPPEYVLGWRFRERLQFTRQVQWWKAEQSRAYQLDQLRRILTLAHQHSPYYRRSFAEAGFDPRDLREPDDLRGLPTIDKAVLRESLEALKVRATHGPDVEYVSTGGTSGTPTHFYIGRERSATEYAYLVASWERVGYRMTVPQAVFRGRMVRETRSGLRHEYDPLLRRHYYSTFHLTDDTMDAYLDHVAGLGPCYLHVYPSATVLLAHFCERTDRAAPSNVLGILAGSENVRAEDREVIERVFRCRLFSWYGHSEKLVMAAECEGSTDYHVWPTYGYCELLDETGRVATTPGQRGEIVGTGFINLVVPFVRYRTGDYATYLGEGCSRCGREHVRLGSIEGHGAEALVARDGQPVSITTFLRAAHAAHMMAVERYQFFQDRPGVAEFRVVLARGATAEQARALADSLVCRTEGQLDLVVRVVDSIALTPAGKYMLLDSRCRGAGAA